jgi:hypothetical protein
MLYSLRMKILFHEAAMQVMLVQLASSMIGVSICPVCMLFNDSQSLLLRFHRERIDVSRGCILLVSTNGCESRLGCWNAVPAAECHKLYM